MFRRRPKRRGADVHVGDATYDGWEVVRDFEDLETALAFRDQIRDAGIKAVLTSGWELGVPIWAHEKEVPLVHNPWGYDHEQPRSKYFVRYPRFAAIFTVMGLNGALFVKGTDNVKTYGSDGVLDVPGKPKIVFTPGHTYGHCALHFPDRSAVIA